MVMELLILWRGGGVFLHVFPNTSLMLHRGSASQNTARGIRVGFPPLTFPAARSLGIFPLLAILPLLTFSCAHPDREKDLPGGKPSVGSWFSEEIVSMPEKHCGEWDEHLFPGQKKSLP